MSEAVSNGTCSAHRVEGILEIVGTGGDGNSGATECIDRGESTGDRLLTAATEPEVGVRERDHADAGGRHELGDALLLGGDVLAEAHAVRGRHRQREPGEHLAGEVLQAEDRRIERLVGVEIDADTGLCGDLQQHIGGGLDVAVVLQVGAPPTRSAPAAERVPEQRPVVGAGGSDHGAAGQRDDLDVDHVGDAAPDLDEREGVHQPAVHGGVGVGPYGDVSVGGHEACRPFGPLDDVVQRRSCRRG